MAKKRIKRILTSSERRKKIRRKRLMRLGIFLIMLLGFIVGLVYLIRLNNFQIKNINISGVSEDKKPEILDEAQSTLKGNKYLFIPKSLVVLYSTRNLENDISQKYSYIQSIKVNKSYPDTINISIISRTPTGLYCDLDCYYIDSTGLIYSSAPSFSSGVYMVYGDQTRNALSSPLQTYFTDESTYALINSFITDIKSLGLNPSRVTFVAPKEIRMDIDQNGYILLGLDRSKEVTLQNLKTVLLQGVTKFEYIDVRYDNKIYYK